MSRTGDVTDQQEHIPKTLRHETIFTHKHTQNAPLTSIGLTGVEGKGCRYSGCKMCPDRAVSIFKTLMGSRFACRSGSDGGAEWRKGLLMFAELLFREPLLSHATQISLFFKADAEGDVIMSQLSGNVVALLSTDSLRKIRWGGKHRASLPGEERKKKNRKTLQ